MYSEGFLHFIVVLWNESIKLLVDSAKLFARSAIIKIHNYIALTSNFLSISHAHAHVRTKEKICQIAHVLGWASWI
jgi:hypothetical protein